MIMLFFVRPGAERRSVLPSLLFPDKQEHDDGGVVTHYGYGYFYANSNNLKTSLSAVILPCISEIIAIFSI